MEISVKINDATPAVMKRLDDAVERFVKKAAAHIEGRLKQKMAEPKSGKRYRRGRDRYHTASAPGEPPAVDSGNLTGSIQQIFPSTLEAKIGTAVEYALYLETGTDRGLSPRPLWAATRDEELQTLEKLLAAETAAIK